MKKLLMIIPLVILLCFTFSCQDKEAMEELEEFRAQAELEEQNKAFVSRLIELEAEGNLENLDKIYAVDCVIHYPGGDYVIGLEAIKEKVAATYKAFPDLHYKLEEPIIAEGDKVAFCYELTGTNQESLMGIPPTGEKVSFKGLTIYRFSEGKTKEVWVQYNSLGLIHQLGMELKPKEGEK
jgi:steroid delta-isomerase-like uncharacterized protein